MLVGHFHIFLGEMSIQVLHPFLNWIAGFVVVVELNESSLYVLGINSLSDI